MKRALTIVLALALLTVLSCGCAGSVNREDAENNPSDSTSPGADLSASSGPQSAAGSVSDVSAAGAEADKISLRHGRHLAVTV